MSRLPPLVRRLVEDRAGGRCEYCRSAVALSGQRFTIDHILATARGGEDDTENLAFCCFDCNSYKQARSAGMDSRTGRSVSFFNPRVEHWESHFRWSATGTRIIGRT